MNDIFPKFIIEDNSIAIGKVTFHKELALNKDKVEGGGWFVLKKEDKQIILYGESHDFGRASEEAIVQAYKANGLGRMQRLIDDQGYKLYYVYELGLELKEITK